MLLKEVCTLDVVTCGARTTTLEAARLMRQRHVGDIVVVADDGEVATPLGVITDRDLVLEVLAVGLDPAQTMVASLLHGPVVIAEDSEDTSVAIERMRTHGVRRLPVVNRHGTVTGIITLDDILALLVTDAGALLQVMKAGRQHEARGRAR